MWSCPTHPQIRFAANRPDTCQQIVSTVCDKCQEANPVSQFGFHPYGCGGNVVAIRCRRKLEVDKDEGD